MTRALTERIKALSETERYELICQIERLEADVAELKQAARAALKDYEKRIWITEREKADYDHPINRLRRVVENKPAERGDVILSSHDVCGGIDLYISGDILDAPAARGEEE